MNKYENWPEQSHPDNAKAYFIDSIEINAPAASVWSWLIRPGMYPYWYRLWPKVEMKHGREEELNKGTQFIPTIKGFRSPTLVVDFEPNRTIAWTGMRFGIRGYHTWVLNELDEVTKVVTEETLVGWLPNLLPWPFIKSGHDMHRHWLAQLKVVSERGCCNEFDFSAISEMAYS